MKKIILVLLIITSLGALQAQESIAFTSGASLGLMPIKLSGTMDVSNSSPFGSTYEPIYKRVDTSSILKAVMVQLGIALPVYRGDDWTTGLLINAGMGAHVDGGAAEGLSTMAFSFPQYIYYRNYATALDFSVLGGYKYIHGIFPAHFILGALEVFIEEVHGIRIYGSFNRSTYYRLLTTDQLEPALQMRDIGITYTYYMEFN